MTMFKSLVLASIGIIARIRYAFITYVATCAVAKMMSGCILVYQTLSIHASITSGDNVIHIQWHALSSVNTYSCGEGLPTL